MKRLLFLFPLPVLICCSNNTDNTTTAHPATVDTAIHSPAQSPIIQPDTGMYGIRLPGAILYLQQWDSTLNLDQQIGKPLKQKTKQLDVNSDTYAGSFTKELEYHGLKLKLFSPPQNGKSFWVQEIILTGKYKTNRNIGIGDEFEKVKEAYPEIQKFPGENDNMYYVANEGYEKSIEMEFFQNKLRKLRMYYMLN